MAAGAHTWRYFPAKYTRCDPQQSARDEFGSSATQSARRIEARTRAGTIFALGGRSSGLFPTAATALRAAVAVAYATALDGLC